MKTKETKNKKRVLFSNTYDDMLFASCCELIAETNGIAREEVDEDEVYEMYNDIQTRDYDDFKATLKKLDTYCRYTFVLFGSVGRWNGSRIGGKYVELSELTSEMSECDEIEIYVENKRVYMTGHHHDGSHHMELRMRKNNVSDNTWEDMLETTIRYSNVQGLTKSTYFIFAEEYGL